jgi:glyoxylase-like metal-dependent hydrolase (beta-lactamase superfamily II)
MKRTPAAIRPPLVAPTRREVVAGIVAVSTLAFAPRARAAIDLGDGELSVVSDGKLSQPISFLLPETPEAEARALFEANGMAFGPVTPDCNVTILRRGDRLAIFDAGSGSNFMETAGRLGENLAAAGFDPAAFTDVILTHAHPDHLWGVLDDLDELVFPNAAYRIARAEHAFWSSPDAFAALPAERASFVAGAQSRLKALGDRLELVAAGAEVFPGVEAVDTSGHTPGHLSYVVHAKSGPTTVLGDAITSAVISFRKPDWRIGPDQDRAKGAETRRKLLDRLAADRSRIVGFHLPHPGVGRVERQGDAFAFVADA